MASAPWINELNKSYLHSVGGDGQYNRDRLFRQMGVDPTKTISLSGHQRDQFKTLLERELGQSLPKGVTIDGAGNVNEAEGFTHYAGKYGPLVGQAALAVATGGMSLPVSMAINAGVGAGLGAAQGGGWKDVLMGAGTGAASAYGGSLLHGAGAAPTATTGASHAATSGGGMNWMNLFKNVGKYADKYGDTAASILGGGGQGQGQGQGTSRGGLADVIGTGLGAMSEADAKNRDAALTAQALIAQQLLARDKNYNDAMLTYEQEGRAGQGQAMARLLGAQHKLAPGAMPMVSPYSVAPRQATDTERDAENLLSQEMMLRLQKGNRLPTPQLTDLQIDRSLMKPGTGEQVKDWLGLGLKGLGALPFGNRQPPQQTRLPNNIFQPDPDLWQETNVRRA